MSFSAETFKGRFFTMFYIELCYVICYSIHYMKQIKEIIRFTSDAGIFTSDAGRFTLDAGRFTSDAGRFTLDAGRFTSDAGRFTLDAGS